MAVELGLLQQSIESSLGGAIADLGSILGIDAVAELIVGESEVLGDAMALVQIERLSDIATNIWVRFDGDSTGCLVLVLSGESAGRLLDELSSLQGGACNDEEMWVDTLGEIGNVVLNGVVKGFIRDYGLKLRTSIPEVRRLS